MSPGFIDTHVSFGFWPWQDFSALTPAALVRDLAAAGIEEAWVSAIESLLFPDPDIPDARLRAAFAPHPEVVPVKTINPLLGHWKESLQRAVEQDGYRLVRVAPAYHLFTLTDPAAFAFASTFAAYGLPLLISMRVEDERNQYPLLRVESLNAHQIAHFAALFPQLRIVVLGALAGEIPVLTRGNPNVLCEISFAETGTTMKTLLASSPADQLAFGSHTPFFYTRAAVRKLSGSDLDAEILRRIARDNARRFQASS
jgi:predicted TIM-barrel fold metal-dependent hydrolase